MNLAVDIGPMRANHERLIYHSWIRALASVRPWSRLDHNYFASAHHCLVEKLLEAPTVAFLVAMEPGDPDQVYGYLVGEIERRVLHWIWVKDGFRRMRVATRLMEAAYQEPGEMIDTTIDTPSLALLQRWNLHPRSYRLCEAIR